MGEDQEEIKIDMSFFDGVLEDKKRVKLIMLASLLMFLVGFVSVFVYTMEKDNIIDACNAHWKNEIKKEYGERPNYDPDLILNFDVGAVADVKIMSSVDDR